MKVIKKIKDIADEHNYELKTNKTMFSFYDKEKIILTVHQVQSKLFHVRMANKHHSIFVKTQSEVFRLIKENL